MKVSRLFSLCVALAFSLSAAAASQTLTRNPRPQTPSAGPAAPEGTCAPTTVLLTHSTSQVLEPGQGITCAYQPGFAHADNSWWRSYRLGDFNILGPIDICEIEFGIDVANAAGTAQPITVNVGVSLDGPFPLGFRLLLGSVTTTLPDQSGTIFVVPLQARIPAGSEMWVEVHVPDAETTGDILFPGANTAPETGPSYLSSVECNLLDPTPLGDIGFPTSHLIINARATEVPIAPASLIFDADPNYVVDIGDTTSMGTSWTNYHPTSVAVTGSMSTILVPPGMVKSFPDPFADYGTIPTGQTGECETTGDCAVLALTGTRAAGSDLDLFAGEVLNIQIETGPTGSNPDKIWEIHVGGSFTDVPSDNLFYAFVENIFHNGVTGGCGGGNYCPGNATLRKQMAVFLLKAFLGAAYLPPAATGIFNDVAADGFQPWIEDLYNRGITGGCSGGPPPAPISYCPDAEVKRKQMAVFLLKTLLGSAYVPPPPTNIFNDVPADGFQPFIEDLYVRGITGGCAGGPPPAPISFCPENPVTRGQMSAFLVKTFLLLLYGP